jgi:hypothetical protein
LGMASSLWLQVAALPARYPCSPSM